jgi:DNA-binding response OmpR family regulator
VDVALVVEDHPSLLRSLVGSLEPWAERVVSAATVTDGLRLLRDERPELAVTDIRLPDGSGLEIARAAAARVPVTTVIAISGQATPDEAFRLAQLGVRSYLTKPLLFEDLAAAITHALTQAPELDPLLRCTVGKAELHHLEDHVRQTLLEEALAQAEGKKSHAAALLAVSRQVLQHMLKSRRDPVTRPDSRK